MSSPSFHSIGVIGAGAWGTALANAIARTGREVTLWHHRPDAARAMQASRQSPHLPGVKLEPSIVVTPDLAEAAARDALLLVVPAQHSRAVCAQLAPLTRAQTPIIACAKGIERGTRRFMTEIVTETVPQARPAILSGPSFAADVARGLPTAVTLAATDLALAGALAQAIGSAAFRPYHASDVRGVEIGGAVKNVLAIAAGIVVGRQLGASALAALTTRGFAEMMRFGRALGARPETLTGLSGLGDLILTCSSAQSRNFAYGERLGRGAAADDGRLTEGHFTASVVGEIARENNLDMPIALMVDAVLGRALSIDEAIGELLARPLRAED